MTCLETFWFHFTFLIILCSSVSSFLMPSFMESGTCSQVSQQENFDINKFMGTWYPVLLVPNEFIAAKHCIAYNYTLHGSHQVTFAETGVDENRAPTARQLILDICEDEECTFITQGAGFRPTIHSTILATDYTTFACMYSCLQRFTFKGEFGWVLSREPRQQRSKVEKCQAIFDEKTNFDWDSLIFLEQGETCPYWDNLTAKRQRALDRENAEASERLDKELTEVVEMAIEEDTDDMQELFYMEDLSGAASTLDTSLIVTLTVVVLLSAMR